MKVRRESPHRFKPDRGLRRGSVLIIVLWVAFGLVAVALYFAQSMSLELRAADNRVAALEAEQAIEGAARYVSNVLASVEEPGLLPDPLTYYAEAVPVGESLFWLIGRDDPAHALNEPVFRLADEASRLNLNTATREMLEALPGMTPELAAAIVDWRDSDDEITPGGAESETYLRRTPAYRCKNANFESVDEVRLVAGAQLDILYGEDTNLNGVLDPNENDGDLSPPNDNRDGRLDPGLLEYLTVYSREPNTRSDGSRRLNVTSASQQELSALLEEHFQAARANEILNRIGPARNNIRSVLEFFVRGRLTAAEMTLLSGEISVSNDDYIQGLVNVNTASEAVLACIPGIGPEKAPLLVAHRQSSPDDPGSLAWVTEVLDENSATQAGPFLTARSYQWTADIAAVGHHGRGYSRVKYFFDTSGEAPEVVARRELTHLGWALGPEVRNLLALAKEAR